MAALDSYRSEHEVAMAGKDKALESLTEQLQQTEEMKVEYSLHSGNLCVVNMAFEH